MSGSGGWDSHRTAAQMEDAGFLIDNGLSVVEAAERVGMLPDTLAKYLGPKVLTDPSHEV